MIGCECRNAGTRRKMMTTADTSPDQSWGELTEAPEDERQAQMQQRYTEVAALPDGERSTRLRAMAQAEYALPDAELRSFTISRLRALLSIDPEAARTITNTYNAVMQQMPGAIAMRRISLIQTLSREFSLDEQHHLRELMPGVFGDQAVAAPAPTSAAAPAAQQPAVPAKKPWWAFWRKG
jgi:hypothetical protein